MKKSQESSKPSEKGAQNKPDVVPSTNKKSEQDQADGEINFSLQKPKVDKSKQKQPTPEVTDVDPAKVRTPRHAKNGVHKATQDQSRCRPQAESGD